MTEPTLRDADDTTPRIPFEERAEIDKLLSRIQDARKAVSQFTSKDSKLDETTLNKLKTIYNQLNYFKRDLSNYLNPTTKQTKVTNKPNKTKQTKLI